MIDSLHTYTKPVTDTDDESGVTTVTQSVEGAANYSGTVVTDYFGRVNSKSITAGDLVLGAAYAYKNLTNSRTTLQVETVTNTVGEVETVYHYEYDTKGNIVEVKLDGNIVAMYEYDEAGQLVRENDTEFAYDKGGNIVNKGDDTFTYSNAWKDQLTSFNDVEIGYDEIGNPDKTVNADGDVLSLEWQGRRLMKVTMPNGNYETYTYNSDGLRTGRKLYDDENSLLTTYAYYWASGELVGYTVTQNGLTTIVKVLDEGLQVGDETYFFVKNLEGDIVKILDNTGAVVTSYDYDAWGNVTASGSADSKNLFGYRGYMFDFETGLYYCQSRYYNANFGQWLSADTLHALYEVNGNNLYAYCTNNPIMLTDLSGKAPRSYFQLTFYFGMFRLMDRILAIIGPATGTNYPEYAYTNYAKNFIPSDDKNEVYELAAIIYAEAGICSYEEKLAVGHAIINRYRDPYHWVGQSVHEIITDTSYGGQFRGYYTNGEYNNYFIQAKNYLEGKSNTLSAEAKKQVMDSFSVAVSVYYYASEDNTNNSTYFNTSSSYNGKNPVGGLTIRIKKGTNGFKMQFLGYK
jgi:RHS repeat-associated protein